MQRAELDVNDLGTRVKKVEHDLDACVTKVERSVAAVPEMVNAVAKNMNEGSDNLKRVDAKVDTNSASNQDLMKTLAAQSGDLATSHSNLPASSSGGGGVTFAEALVRQSRFNMALSLGHSPTMFFLEGSYKNTCSLVPCFGTRSTKLLTIR